MKLIPYILALVLFFLVAPFVSEAQQKTPPKIEWQKCLGGSRDDYGTSIQQTKDGGYVVSGYSDSFDGDVNKINVGNEYWIVKLSMLGTIEWSKTYGGNSDDFAYAIKQTTDGGYIVGGKSYSTDVDVKDHNGTSQYSDFWVVKLTSNGEINWERSLGGSLDDIAVSVRETSDGGYIAAGVSHSTDIMVSGNHGGGDCWIVKLSSSGTRQWEKSLGGSKLDYASSIEQTNDSGYIIVGYSESFDGDVTSNHGKFDLWLVKLSNDGNIEWEKTLGGSSHDYGMSVQQTSDGGFIAVGMSKSNDGDLTNHYGNNVYHDCWVVKLNDKGAIEWQQSLGGSLGEAGYSVQQTRDGGYVVAGYTDSYDFDITDSHGLTDGWLVKFSGVGDIEWKKTYGGSHIDVISSLTLVGDHNYVVVGNTGSTDGDVSGHYDSTVNRDLWIVRLNLDSTKGVKKKIQISPSFIVNPNPASSSATLTLESDEAGACEVQIISVTGATLKEYSTHLAIGKQEIALDGLESLPSGMYEVLVKRSGHKTLQTKLIVE